jgi:hypothetical protein
MRVQLRLESGQVLGHTMARLGDAVGSAVELGGKKYEVVGAETYDPEDVGLPADDDDADSEVVFIVRPL